MSSTTAYVTNCPNCGAPITRFGHCEYCGTLIHQPLQLVAVRPGIRKLTALSKIPLFVGEHDPETVAEYAKRDIRSKMADALTDSVKFIVRRDHDPYRCEEIISVRGELWIAEPDVNW